MVSKQIRVPNTEVDQVTVHSSFTCNKECRDRTLDEETSIQKTGKRIPGLGIGLCLISSLFFGSAGYLVKVTRSVSGIQISIYRCLFQLIWYGGVILSSRASFRPHKDEYWGTAFRAIPGGVSITLIYAAIQLIPLGDATTIRFSLPIWTLLIGAVVLRESCTFLKIGAVIMSLAGVALIAKPNECVHLLSMLIGVTSDEIPHEQLSVAATHIQLIGSLVALSSSITLALSIVGLRMCTRTDSKVVIFWLSVSAVVLSCTYLIIVDYKTLFSSKMLPDNSIDVIYLLLNGLCGTIGQYFLTLSSKLEESGPISLARTFDIIVAFGYSALVLHETINLTSVIGAIMVSSSVSSLVLAKWINCCNSGSK